MGDAPAGRAEPLSAPASQGPRAPTLVDALLSIVARTRRRGSLIAAVNGSGVGLNVIASGVLGVSTAAYFPYCFFNLLSPILDVLYGFLGFKVPEAERPWGDESPATPHQYVRRPGESHG